MAVGASSVVVGGIILSSTDGMNWSSQSVANQLYGVTWSGTQFVVVGQNGTILTSPDGVNWTSRVSGVSGPLVSIIWSGTQFAAGGHNGSSIDPIGTILHQMA